MLFIYLFFFIEDFVSFIFQNFDVLVLSLVQ
jgi:hypothetical protein